MLEKQDASVPDLDHSLALGCCCGRLHEASDDAEPRPGKALSYGIRSWIRTPHRADGRDPGRSVRPHTLVTCACAASKFALNLFPLRSLARARVSHHVIQGAIPGEASPGWPLRFNPIRQSAEVDREGGPPLTDIGCLAG